MITIQKNKLKLHYKNSSTATAKVHKTNMWVLHLHFEYANGQHFANTMHEHISVHSLLLTLTGLMYIMLVSAHTFMFTTIRLHTTNFN